VTIGFELKESPQNNVCDCQIRIGEQAGKTRETAGVENPDAAKDLSPVYLVTGSTGYVGGRLFTKVVPWRTVRFLTVRAPLRCSFRVSSYGIA